MHIFRIEFQKIKIDFSRNVSTTFTEGSLLFYFFDNLDKAIDVYKHYEKVLLVGDFNAEI